MDTPTAYPAAGSLSPLADRSWWQLAAIAGGLAAVANLVLYLLVDRIGGLNLRIPASPGETSLTDLGPIPVVLMSVLPAIVATLLAAALARWTDAPHRWFLAIAAIALIASLIPPLSIAGASTGNKATLIAMHVVAAGPIIAVLAGRLPAGRSAARRRR